MDNTGHSDAVGSDVERVAYTAGPWTVCEDDAPVLAVKSGEYYIATTHGHIGKINWTLDDTRANARLIAAAPDLLEALRKIKALTDTGEPDWNDAIGDIARAAIRKAEQSNG